MKRVEDVAELQRIANRIRQTIGGAPAGELIAALFFWVMRHDPNKPTWPDRDRLILSKGHALQALHYAYAEAGYPDQRVLPILEASTGSLGSGLSIGMGAALAAKLNGKEYRVYVMLGDDECDEGQAWDAIKLAPVHKLDNLIAIVDGNKTETLKAKWEAFGWRALKIDSHDMAAVLEAFEQAKMTDGRPTLIMKVQS